MATSFTAAPFQSCLRLQHLLSLEYEQLEIAFKINLPAIGSLDNPLKGSLRDPEMTSRRTRLQEDTHFRVLRLLQRDSEMSQRELAEAVGVSAGGMHYVLNALIAKGFVRLESFTAAEDKRRYAYILTPEGLAEKVALTRQFLVRKIQEYESLKVEIKELDIEMDSYHAHCHEISGDI